MFISYAFCIGVFCATILKTFLETIIVFWYCLKFLSSKGSSYWMKDAFVKTIFASRAGIAVPAAKSFLNLKKILIFVSMWY